MTMKLALGTVQFGLNYGITNTRGKVAITEVMDILTFAKNIGITTLDTAAAYGESEVVLGELGASESFDIVTKIPQLTSGVTIENIVTQSCKNLHCKKITALLFHHADDLISPQGQYYYQQAQALKNQGTIEKLGVSVYRPEQISLLCQQFNFDIIQLPLNWLDQRFLRDDLQATLSNIEIHARSIFLQGILLAEFNELPAYFLPYKRQIDNFNLYCKNLGCQPLTLALAIIHQQNIVDKAVIGCCSVNQLTQIAEHYYLAEKLIHLNGEKIINIGKKLASNEETLVDPSQWKIIH
jgi:aryl-alcohol dehydrogenase-like predicted oxidoreductase